MRQDAFVTDEWDRVFMMRRRPLVRRGRASGEVTDWAAERRRRASSCRHPRAVADSGAHGVAVSDARPRVRTTVGRRRGRRRCGTTTAAARPRVAHDLRQQDGVRHVGPRRPRASRTTSSRPRTFGSTRRSRARELLGGGAADDDDLYIGLFDLAAQNIFVIWNLQGSGLRICEWRPRSDGGSLPSVRACFWQPQTPSRVRRRSKFAIVTYL